MTDKLAVRLSADELWELREKVLPLFDQAVEVFDQAGRATSLTFAIVSVQSREIVDSLEESVRQLGRAAAAVDFASRRLSDYASECEAERRKILKETGR